MSELSVEVVFALERQQSLVSVTVPAGSTVKSVIDSSRIQERFPDIDLADLPVGIWGRLADRGDTVQSGDRVEIYRSLQMDPKEARRQRALAIESTGRIEAG
jgi:uncharacterized protein